MPLLALESFWLPGAKSLSMEPSVQLMTKLLLGLYHAFMNKFHHLSII